MAKNTQKRSINFSTETLESLDKLAAKKHTTASELVRGYVDKGLSIEGNREDIDFIAQIIRQELTAVYHVTESPLSSSLSDCLSHRLSRNTQAAVYHV